MDEMCMLCVCLLGLLCLSWGSELDRCPSGLTRSRFLKVFGGQCYRFNHYQETWHDAQSICSRNNGHLVVIKNYNTQAFIMRTLKSLEWRRNGIWIGANDIDREMRWKWVTGENIGYSNWASGQPSCNIFFCREDCGILRYSDGGRWHDKSCDSILYLYSFVCQYDMTPTTTTSTTTTKVATKTTTTTTTVPTTSFKIKIVQKDLLKKQTKTLLNKVSNKTTENTTFMEKLKHTTTLSTKYHVVLNNPGQQKQRLETSSEDSVPTGTVIALALGILLGLLTGVCFTAVCFVRRKRKAQAENMSISFENPYYGDVTCPLQKEEVDDQNEQSCVMVFADEAKHVEYDTPASLSLNNPTYGQVAPVASNDTNDEQYDLPKPTPCGPMNDIYENSNPAEENFYEDIDSLKAAIAMNESLGKCEEEDRYVSMPTKNGM